MKKTILLVSLLIFILIFSPAAHASTTLPDAVYLEQAEDNTCTLASAAMMIRARAFLSNYGSWDAILESSIRSTAWAPGLSYSFTYEFGGNSISVAHKSVSGISSSSLKSLLDSHSEGLVLYCKNIPHAVFVCDYEGDTFYCADPGAKYCSSIPRGRIQLGDSSLSKSYENQNTILENTTDYWYVTEYSISPTAPPEVRGSEMTFGYERVIPDGDYMIAIAGTGATSNFYFLDIEGETSYATNETNVSIWGPLDYEPPSYEVWTVIYNPNDGFYTIKQYGTNMCLDVCDADTLQGKNVQVYEGNGSSAQKWAISRNGSTGYRIQAKCSGMSLDVYNGNINAGENVQQFRSNDTIAQSWHFIPYQPTQPIEDGRYILLYAPNPKYELDVEGNTDNLENNTNVRLWGDTALSKYNSFDVIKLTNGYYKIKHAVSGKCLDVADGSSGYKTNVVVYDDNGSAAQQWAIVPNGAGYSMIAKCNGYALDLPDGNTENGHNIEMYPRFENSNQRWSFVQAEYNIEYSADGGTCVPSSQTKYYRNDLILSSRAPKRTGYIFLYWEDILSLNENMETDHYYPGDIYSADKGLSLYAVWEPISFVLPSNLTTIEGEAFAGIKNCVVRVPDDVTYVSPSAFDSSVTLVVSSGSAAAKAVKNLGLTVIEE